MTSVVSTKGQVTIPAEVRQRLGLRPGTAVRFEMRPDGVLLRKGSEVHPVDQVFGRLRLTKAVDDSLDELRGPRPGKRGSR